MNSNWVMQEKHLTLFAGNIFLVSATGSAIAQEQEPTKPLKERIVGTWGQNRVDAENLPPRNEPTMCAFASREAGPWTPLYGAYLSL